MKTNECNLRPEYIPPTVSPHEVLEILKAQLEILKLLSQPPMLFIPAGSKADLDIGGFRK